MAQPPFDHVVSAHGATVLQVCRAVLGESDAFDAWSDTFVAALRAYPELRDDSDLRAWLVTIAHRKAIDHLRARDRRATPLEMVPDRGIAPAEPADDELWQALAALPHTQRAAIAYHHLGGLPYAEVGELLGNSADAARRAACDGLAALRLRLHHRSPR